MKHQMKELLRSVAVPAVCACCICACDDDTGSFGSVMMPETDDPVVSQALFYATTSSFKADSLVSNTSDCYLGRVTDPETGSTTTCHFLAQFYQLEDYDLPSIDQMMQDEDGVIADSVDLRLYINSYYGDSLNSMKLGVYELDSVNVLEEDETYYTNIDPTQYLSTSPNAISKTVSFAVTDLSVEDTTRYSDDYSKNILIKLPTDYGTKILRLYYEHPEYFSNSYQFIRHVVPGFYFKTLSGNGTMVEIDVSVLSVYFSYVIDDSVYVGVQRVAATEEVLQNNSIENEGLDELLSSEDYTMLKTPAGIFTEVVLPIDSIYYEHETDTVNSAKIVFSRYNNTLKTMYNLEPPDQILIIPTTEMTEFFENHDLPDGRTTFVSSYSEDYNSYTFSNIANMISYMKLTRDTEAGVEDDDSDEERDEKRKAWEEENPDWNKVLLVPVVTQSSSSGSYTKVNNDFSLSSTKLAGGENTPIQMTIIYSTFE